MARAFSEIAFTPAVRAAQERQGSAAAYDRFLAPEANPAGSFHAQVVSALDGRPIAGAWMARHDSSGPPTAGSALLLRTASAFCVPMKLPSVQTP